MATWTNSTERVFGSPGRVATAKDLFSGEVLIYLTGARIKSILLLLAFISLTIQPAAAQFNTPTIDGVISAGEYGTHTDGNNQQTNGGTVWYMTWDATNLYIGISGASVSEGAVIYVDGNPIAPINGGTNADGTLVGQNYDGTSFAALQFRADYVSFFKDGYREHRTADGSNSWSGATTSSGSYFSNGSNVREYAIAWSNIAGGIPSSFNWFGYVTTSGGFVYGEMPTENGGGNIGTSAREQRYFTVSSTSNGASTKPFSRNSYVFNSASDISGFGSISVFDFTMNSSGRQIFRSADGSTWTIGGNLRVDAGTINFDNTTGAATVSSNVVISSGGTLNLGNVVGGDLNLTGSWTNNGTLNHNSRTVTFNGTGTQTISGSSTTNFGFLTVNMGTSNSNVLDVQSVIALAGSPNPLTITNGTFKLSSSSTITPFTSGPTIPASGGYWQNGGTTNAGGFSWILNGLLRVSNGSLGIGTGAGNSLHFNTGSTITIEGGSVSISGRLNPNGSASLTTTYSQSGGTVTVVTNSSTSASRAGFEITSGSSFTMSGGTIVVERATSNTTGDYLNLATTNSVTGGTLQIGDGSSPNAAVIRINSTAPVYHLTVNNSTTNATKPAAQLLTNGLTIKGDATIQSGTTLNANSLNINLAGNWSNSGTFTPGTSTVTMNGTSAQTMSGSTFNSLTINNASGITLLTDETVSNTLTLTSGNVTTTSNKMIIAAGGTVSRTSGHIVGNLQKNFATGASIARTFEVGTGSNYTPVNVNIASVSTAGNVTAKSTAGDHSSIASSTLDASKSVNRNWTLTSDGTLALTNYEATFNFVAGDLDGGVNTSNLAAGKLDGGTWTYPTVGTRTATSTQATGMTSFSDFQLAESTAPEMDVQGNAISIADGDATPSTTDGTDFGSAAINVTDIAHVFTIVNTGAAALNLTGTPKVQISGPQASDFSILGQPSSPIATNGGTATFNVRFRASAVGLRSATISIANDDADENPYDFAIQGTGTATAEMNVLGNNASIVDGDATPSTTDDTDFGTADISVPQGGIDHIFTITNASSAALNLTGTPDKVQITGAHATDFSVTVQPTSPVAANGGMTTFTVRFDPSATGLRSATISIANDDADENPYDFAIQGTGTATPEMDVLGGVTSIADGDGTPSTTDGTDFGSAAINVTDIAHVFTIVNTGAAALNLTGTPKVQISGPQASDFSILGQPSSPIATNGGTATFNVRFRASAVGLRSATISIANDDADENPYDFAIQGTGTGAAATALVSGDATICAGSLTTIQAALTGTAPWNLTWSDSYVQNGVAASPAIRSVSPTATTVYTLTSFSDANGPGTTSGSATVTVNPNSVVANAGADLAITSGVSAKIGGNPTANGGNGALTINWSPSTGLSSTTAANPTATPSSTTTYTLTVTDANNCVGTDQVTVRAGNLVNSRIKSFIGPTNIYDPILNQVRVDISIKNISTAPIYGPLTAVFKTLTPGPPTITIPNANGGGTGLGCYYDYSNLLGGDNILSPGETSGYKLWIFQENVTPAVSFKFFANIIGDLDNIPKNAADDLPLAFSFEVRKNAVQDHADSKLAGNAAEIPETYALHQNHPNPFSANGIFDNPNTTIQFDLPKAGEVTLVIYNLNGRLVRQFVAGEKPAGRHDVKWDAKDDRGVQVASGVYLYVLKAGGFTAQRKLVLMK